VINSLPEPTSGSVIGKSSLSADRSSGRGAKWLVGLTVALLAIVSIADYLFYRFQMSSIAAEHLRLMVTGPSSLQAGAAAQFDVSTTEVTGIPVSTPVEVNLFSPDGKRLLGRRESTDEHGRMQFIIPADMSLPGSATLKVMALHRGNREEMSASLAVESTRFLTRLSLDKPLYQPGETVFYRSLSLSSFGLAVERELPIHFEILNPEGAVVPNSQNEGVTDHGVGNGAFILPDNLPGGHYTLVARALDGFFPEQRQGFFVRRYRLPQWEKELEFLRASYAPGEPVEAVFSAKRAQGEPAAAAKLRLLATVDEQTILDNAVQTNDQGEFKIEMKLPKKISRGDARLTVIINQGGVSETISKPIPINLGKVDIHFYPEGGNLVAGLENRIYFTSCDPLGHPVHIMGTIVSDNGQIVSSAETADLGMGQFSFTPQPGESYRLKIITPADVKEEYKLPAVVTDCPIVLTTGTGVFGPSEPLEFNIRSLKANLPLVVGAWCRGVLVGQTALITKKSENGMNPVVLQLPDGLGGVIRLTVFDYSMSPDQTQMPKPLAERLVYRRPDRQLNVRATENKASYSPGEKVTLSLAVTNEKNEPVAAALAVAVVDKALLALADRPEPGITTYFLLANQIENPQDLENADFYLSEDKTTSVPPALALDLLLGTQGWRRFVEKNSPQIKEDSPDKMQNALPASAGNVTFPPIMFDNLSQLREDYQKNLAAYHANQMQLLYTTITISFLAACGLLLLVMMLGLLRIVKGASFWLSLLVSSACCVVIGTLLISPDPLANGNIQAAAFLTYHAPKSAVAAKKNTPEQPAKKAPLETVGLPPDGRQWRWASAVLPDRIAANQQLLNTGSMRGESKNLDKERQALNQELARRRLPELSKLDAKQLEQYRFIVRQYAHEHLAGQPGVGSDFAETLFWYPLLIAGPDGKATLSFDLSDAITTFLLVADAHGDGRIGSGRVEIISKTPDNIETK
jgi:hypothetical protein